MSQLFISYSEHDEDDAFELARWLDDQGWSNLQMSQAPAWSAVDEADTSKTLEQKSRRCEAVLFLITPDWVNSDQCRSQFDYFKELNKPMFGLVIAKTPPQTIPNDLADEWYVFDFSNLPTLSKKGASRLTGDEHRESLLKELQIKLLTYALDADYLEWPPRHDDNRSPYRGVQSYERCDGGIYFGRDQLVAEAMDAARSLRKSGGFQALMISGEQGVGKSSFMEAGLLARLDCEREHFLVMPTLQPSSGVLYGREGLVESIRKILGDLGLPNHPQRIAAALENDFQTNPEPLNTGQSSEIGRFGLLDIFCEAIETWSRLNSSGARTATLVLPIDQMDDLLAYGDIVQNEAFKRVISSLKAQDKLSILFVSTLHSNALRTVSNEFLGNSLSIRELVVPMMPFASFSQIATRSAERYWSNGQGIEPTDGLVTRLETDLEGEQDIQTLSQFSLTLHTLFEHNRTNGRLTKEMYEDLGGLEGVLKALIEKVTASSQTLPDAGFHSRLSNRFVVRSPVTQSLRSQPLAWSRISDEHFALIESFKKLGLAKPGSITVSHDRGKTHIEEETVFVPVCIFNGKWSPFADAVNQNLELLKAIGIIQQTSANWLAHEKGNEFLIHRETDLAEAEAATFQNVLMGYFLEHHLAYVQACRFAANLEIDNKALVHRRQAISMQAAALTSILFMLFAVGFGWDRYKETQSAQINLMEAQNQKGQAEQALLKSEKDRDDAEHAMAIARAQEQKVRRSLLQSNTNLANNVIEKTTKRELDDHPQLKINLTLEAVNLLVAAGVDEEVLSGPLEQLSALYPKDRLLVAVATKDQFNTARFSPDGSLFLTLSREEPPKVWDAKTGLLLYALKGHESSVNSADFSPDGRYIVTGSIDATARIWDTKDGRELAVLSGHDISVSHVAFSPDSKKVATASLDSTSALWDVETSALISRQLGHSSVVNHVTFSPDGRLLATSANDLRIWSVETGKLVTIFEGHLESVNHAAFSASGDYLVTASDDATARIWNVKTGRPGKILNPQKGPLKKVIIGANDQLIASVTSDHQLDMWRGQNFENHLALTGHRGDINSVSFDPKGRWIASVSNDQTAKIWEASTGRHIVTLNDHNAPVVDVHFTSDGQRLLTVADKVRIWHAVPQRRLAEEYRFDRRSVAVNFANARRISALSTEQRQKYNLESQLLFVPPKANNACDEYGVDPNDKTAFGPPVELSELVNKAEDALAACQLEAALRPSSGHFMHQIARSYLALNNNGRAREYFERAAQVGHSLSDFSLAQMTEADGNPYAALELYDKAIEGGYAGAAYRAGEIYWHGTGVPPNKKTAVEFWKTGARMKDAASHMGLARLYAAGSLVALNPLQRDLGEARYHYSQAIQIYSKTGEIERLEFAQRRLGSVVRQLGAKKFTTTKLN